jgi:hypothetical protein
VGETQHGGNAAVMNSDGRETGWAPVFATPANVIEPHLVHRLISGRHTVGFKRVWMPGASEERIRCDT